MKSIQVVNAPFPALGEELENHLSIGLSVELVSPLFELGAKLDVAENLAVVGGRQTNHHSPGDFSLRKV